MIDLSIAPSSQHPPVSIPLPHAVSSASLHPINRDRFIVGSSADPWVRVYDLDSGKETEVYKGHHGPVHCVSYSPDGEVYASGSEDGMRGVSLSGHDPNRLILVLSQEPFVSGRRILGRITACGSRRTGPVLRMERQAASRSRAVFLAILESVIALLRASTRQRHCHTQATTRLDRRQETSRTLARGPSRLSTHHPY